MDLHRERSDPDDNKKEKNSAALSVEEFMDFVTKDWKADKEVKIEIEVSVLDWFGWEPCS
ncbi:hypothetical protein ABVK25_005087 [Lepraria finkii]|uniref:Uncharacterized protein n=1 Tax=Lepraria finkii TaxID=1340010 RepID=A0ABR4BBI5_9LECA